MTYEGVRRIQKVRARRRRRPVLERASATRQQYSWCQRFQQKGKLATKLPHRDSNPSLLFVEARGVPVSVAFTIFGVNVSVRVFTCDGREDA